MAIVAAPALEAASSHRCVPGRGAWEGAMGAGTGMGTVLPALCRRAIWGLLGGLGSWHPPGWQRVLCGSRSESPASFCVGTTPKRGCILLPG